MAGALLLANAMVYGVPDGNGPTGNLASDIGFHIVEDTSTMWVSRPALYRSPYVPTGQVLRSNRTSSAVRGRSVERGLAKVERGTSSWRSAPCPAPQPRLQGLATGEFARRARVRPPSPFPLGVGCELGRDPGRPKLRTSISARRAAIRVRSAKSS